MSATSEGGTEDVRHWLDGRLAQFLPDFDFDFSPLLVEARLDIAHRDVLR